jgi:hypothetical protein
MHRSFPYTSGKYKNIVDPATRAGGLVAGMQAYE